MDFLSQATNVSNWTLSLILGFTAALQSGAEKGIVGELPICDVLLVVDPREVPNGLSGDNVVIGFESKWSKMMLRSLYSKRLKFCYLMPKKDKSKDKRNSKCECHMVVNPMWKRWNDNQHPPNETTKLVEEGKTSKPEEISPNMFYGLVEDFTPPKNDNKQDNQPKTISESYKIIHSPECIPKLNIDCRAVEFLSENLSNSLKEKSNAEALILCKKIIEDMGEKVLNCKREDCNEWDKRIIKRLYMVMEYPVLEAAKKEDVPIDEVIDRIHSRIPEMLQRLGMETFKLEGYDEAFTIKDITRATVIYFGVKRAIEFSRRIYEEDALVVMGYNIDVGHELINDITEIPSTLTSGFSTKTVLDNTPKKRFIEKKIERNSIFIVAIAIDAMLAAATMILSGLGPTLSMFTSRRMTAPYRESSLQLGTTMRWSVRTLSLFHSGSARDDWMFCIQPAQKVNRNIYGFLALSSFSPLLCATLWALPYGHQHIMNPDLLPDGAPLIDKFGRLVCILSLVVGIPWVVMSQLVQCNNNKSLMKSLWSTTTIHTTANISLVVLLSALVFSNIELPWVYLYVLEAVYFGQWLIGELTENWSFESTSLLMVGVLGAVRLSNAPESD